MTDSRRVIYVASPLRGNYELHTEMAKVLARDLQVISEGRLIPFVPHLHFTQFLNDGDEIERGVGMDAARYVLRVCDELWIFGGLGISSGMRDEEIYADHIGMPVRHFATLTEWRGAAKAVLEMELDDVGQSFRLSNRWEKVASAVSARELATLDALARLIAPDSFSGVDGIEGMGKLIIERTGMAVSEVIDLRTRIESLEEQLTGMVMSRDQAIDLKNTAEEQLASAKAELTTAWKGLEDTRTELATALHEVECLVDGAVE